MCVCERERERERERTWCITKVKISKMGDPCVPLSKSSPAQKQLSVCVCERGRERVRLCGYVCVCVFVSVFVCDFVCVCACVFTCMHVSHLVETSLVLFWFFSKT